MGKNDYFQKHNKPQQSTNRVYISWSQRRVMRTISFLTWDYSSSLSFNS